jgi:hypothetical protein
MSAPVAGTPEYRSEILGRKLYRVPVTVGVDRYNVAVITFNGGAMVTSTRTHTGRQATGNRRADIERCAIDAVLV